MPHVTGTARRSPRKSVSGRDTPSRFARRCVNDNHAPSSTRAPTRARRPTCQVPSARRSRTSVAPTNQIAATTASLLTGNERADETTVAGWEGIALRTAGSVRVVVCSAGVLSIAPPTDLSTTDGDTASEVSTTDGVDSLATHGAAGSNGIRHAGNSNMKTGIARCPITAALHTA